MQRARFGPALAVSLALLAAAAQAEVHNGNPGNYRDLVPTLQPGDTLLLEAGTYTQGLRIADLHGQPGSPIVISGPASGAPALFQGSSVRNTISLVRSSHITIRHLQLDGLGLEGDGVKAEGEPGNFAHHITLEDLLIENHDANQQIVGISTKCPAWDWAIRRCTIRRAGTGIYLGNSDGSAPFVNGLLEHNLILDTIGYNAQIKHQNDRPDLPGLPRNGTTILRHNVFSKLNNGSSGDDARPCLLVGHWPLTGDGADDVYQIYGNFFYENPNEALFQGEGNVALYANLFVQSSGDAVNVQQHEDAPRTIRIFYNTVLAGDVGIRVSGGDPGSTQKVLGNAVFAGDPIRAADQQDNVTGARAAASTFLQAPDAPLGQLDLYPRPGMLTGTAVDATQISAFVDWDLDFDGAAHPATFRGAYGGEGQNPGWLPRLEIKPAAAAEPTVTPTLPPPTGTPSVTPTPPPPTATPTSDGSTPTPSRTPAPAPAPGSGGSLLPLALALLAAGLLRRPARRRAGSQSLYRASR